MKTFSKQIGKALAEAVEELVLLEDFQLDEIRDPALLKAQMKQLETSAHPTAAARLSRLQQLHDRKIASTEVRQQRQLANEAKMHAVAKKFGYKPLKGQSGHFGRDGHVLKIGPGNMWSHKKAGNVRSTIGKSPIRDLMKHLRNLHPMNEEVNLSEGALSVSRTPSGFAVAAGPRGAKKVVAGPFPSKYAATIHKQAILARFAGAAGHLGEDEVSPKMMDAQPELPESENKVPSKRKIEPDWKWNERLQAYKCQNCGAKYHDISYPHDCPGEQVDEGKNYAQVAASVAKNKDKHPEQYCPTKKCLWKTGGGYCPRHGGSKIEVKESIVENDSKRFVVHPHKAMFDELPDAKKEAKAYSKRNGHARIEDTHTNKVHSRWEYGKVPSDDEQKNRAAADAISRSYKEPVSVGNKKWTPDGWRKS